MVPETAERNVRRKADGTGLFTYIGVVSGVNVGLYIPCMDVLGTGTPPHPSVVSSGLDAVAFSTGRGDPS